MWQLVKPISQLNRVRPALRVDGRDSCPVRQGDLRIEVSQIKLRQRPRTVRRQTVDGSCSGTDALLTRVNNLRSENQVIQEAIQRNELAIYDLVQQGELLASNSQAIRTDADEISSQLSHMAPDGTVPPSFTAFVSYIDAQERDIGLITQSVASQQLMIKGLYQSFENIGQQKEVRNLVDDLTCRIGQLQQRSLLNKMAIQDLVSVVDKKQQVQQVSILKMEVDALKKRVSEAFGAADSPCNDGEHNHTPLRE